MSEQFSNVLDALQKAVPTIIAAVMIALVTAVISNTMARMQLSVELQSMKDRYTEEIESLEAQMVELNERTIYIRDVVVPIIDRQSEKMLRVERRLDRIQRQLEMLNDRAIYRSESLP